MQWMQAPPAVVGVPPGLEYLTQIDQLIASQQVELLEVLTGFETKNRFKVFNTMNQQVYFAQEESTCLQRQCCGNSRGFEYHITDNNNQKVLKFIRAFKCCAGNSWFACCSGCAWEMEVVSPITNETLGYVRQAQSCWSARIHILTAERDLIGVIKGPCCACSCCGDVEFPLFAPDDATVFGKISKQWSGAAKEIFTDADTFSVTFPMDLDVKAKATVFGALFLVDMMFFEESNKDN